MLDAVIEGGDDVNLLVDIDCTPLAIAVTQCYDYESGDLTAKSRKVVTLLIDAGADVDLPDPPLHMPPLPCSRGHTLCLPNVGCAAYQRTLF